MVEIELRHLEPFGITREEAIAPFALGSAEELLALCAQAALVQVEVAPRSLEVRFPAEHFVEDSMFSYAAVVPKFAVDPAAFTAFVDVVNRESEELRERHRQGDTLAFTMHTHLVSAAA